MKNEKIYVIFKDDNEYHIGYYYPPGNFRETKKFSRVKEVMIYTIKGFGHSNNLISKKDIIKRHKSEKYLKKHYPQYFI